MALKVKAKEQLQNVGKYAGSFRYIMLPELYTSLAKEELSKTAVQITCIDRNGKEVKRVTSDDHGIIEDPENQNPGGNPGGGSEED